MASLHGAYNHKLDAKGRLSLPSAFRKALSTDDLVVTQSPDGECLYVFEPEGFEAWVDALFMKDGGYDPSNTRHYRQRKVLNSRANDVVIDASGRIGLSAAMRSLAALDKEAVLIGDSDHFEIWDSSRWEDFRDSVVFDSLFSG